MKKFFKSCISILLGAALLVPVTACGKRKTPPPDKGEQEEPPKAPVYALTLNKEDLTLAEAESAKTATLSATVTADGKAVEGATVTYVSGNPQIATVSENGTVTAVAAGKTTITATYRTGDKEVKDSAEVSVLASATEEEINKLEQGAVNLYGRTYVSAKRVVLDNVCTGVEVYFIGTELEVSLTISAKSKIRTFVDGDEEGVDTLLTARKTFKVCENLTEGLHSVRILKASNQENGKIYLPVGSAFKTDGTFLKAKEKSELKIEFVGDSITEGYGVFPKGGEFTMETSDATKAYAYLTAQTLDADFSVMALAGICVKDGAVNSYDTYTTLSTTNSTQYDPAQFEADVVVLALGENDMWHATSSQFEYTIEAFRADYADMLRLIRKSHPNAKIVCIYGMMPASSKAQAATTIQGAIEDTGDKNITTLAMLCDENGAASHPNASAHKKNASTLVKHIQKIMGGEA